MYRDKKVVVVMPAYNAAKTLRKTYAEVQEQGLVDHIILVDDGSRDDTVNIAKTLPGVQVHWPSSVEDPPQAAIAIMARARCT